jgi:hypothetical protein
MTIPPAPLPRFLDLVRAPLVRPSKGCVWARNPSAQVRLFERGAVALAAAVQSIKEAHPDEKITTWLPDLMCSEPVDWLHAFGFQVAFYRTTDQLEPDWSDVEPRFSSDGVHILVIVHYFGFPNQGLARAMELGGRQNIVVVEDAAHALGPCRGIGQAPLVVYSPRKVLAVSWVGCLVDETGRTPEEGKQHEGVGVWLFKRVVQRILRALHLHWHHRWAERRDEVENANVVPGWHGSGRIARGLLALDEERIDEVRERRRSHYLRLERYVQRVNFLAPLLFRLPDDACPFAFPTVVSGPIDRVLRSLRSAGIPASLWPGLPHEILRNPEQYGRAIALSQSLMLLPIHHGLSDSEVDVIGERLLALDHELATQSFDKVI